WTRRPCRRPSGSRSGTSVPRSCPTCPWARACARRRRRLVGRSTWWLVTFLWRSSRSSVCMAVGGVSDGRDRRSRRDLDVLVGHHELGVEARLDRALLHEATDLVEAFVVGPKWLGLTLAVDQAGNE